MSEERAGPTLVTPTRRLAHALREARERELQQSGARVWFTPDIRSFDDLVADLLNADRQAGRIRERWLPVAAGQLLWERIVDADPLADEFVFAGGIAQAAMRAWRRLHAWAIPLAALQAAPSMETMAFARWAALYAVQLDEQGWIDEARAPDRVSPAAAPRHLQLKGFTRYTPQQLSLIARLEQTGVVIEREAEPELDPDPEPLPLERSKLEIVACRDALAEVDAAARWAVRLIRENPRRRVAIVAPDLQQRREALRRLLDRVFEPDTGLVGGTAPESTRYELVAPVELTRQPLVAAALELLRLCIVGSDWPSVSALLASPCIRDAQREAPARASLDAWLRRRGGAAPSPASLATIAASQACPSLASCLVEGLSAVESWPQKNVPSGWSERFLNLLPKLGWPGPELDSRAYQAAERWRAMLAEYAACDDFLGPCTAAQALWRVRAMATGVLFQPQSPSASLTIIDAATSVGMQFDALWVCGLEASQWPPPASPDPFLPVEWQRRRGIPGANAEICERDARQLLGRLMASATQVVLSLPRFDGEAVLLPSALLGGHAPSEPAADWPQPTLAQHMFEQRPALLQLWNGDFPPVTGAELGAGGARLMELQSACAFRAQAEGRLAARRLETPALGLDARLRGTLLHGALERLWRDLAGQEALIQLSPGEARALVAARVEQALRALPASDDEFLRSLLELESRWLQQRIAELLALDRQRGPFVVDASEQEVELRLGELRLRLRPDRVDRLADGSLVVIDYKTGRDADPKTWLGERPQLPQLPMYALAMPADAVTAAAFARLRAGDTAYAGWSAAQLEFPGVKPLPQKVGPDWASLMQAWRGRLERLAAEYLRGEADLAAQPARACRHCHLQTLCRIDEVDGDASADDEDEDAAETEASNTGRLRS